MKCPKKHVKDDFVMWLHLPIYLKCPKIEEFHFRFWNWSRAKYLKCPTFLWSKYLKCCPIFPIWFWKWEKWGISNISNIEKWGISNYSHMINFKTENEILRFWGISNKWANAITWQNHPSHAFWGISYYSPYVFMKYVNMTKTLL